MLSTRGTLFIVISSQRIFSSTGREMPNSVTLESSRTMNLMTTDLYSTVRIVEFLKGRIMEGSASHYLFFNLLLVSTIGAETFVGTLNYMSPERVQSKKYSSKADIWSLGLALYSVFTGESAIPKNVGGYWGVLAYFQTLITEGTYIRV